MNRIRLTRIIVIALSSIALFGADDPKPTGKVVYQNDFEKTALGKAPDEFLIVGGDFAIVSEAGKNQYLELPGTPLDYFGLLFGPAEHAQVRVSARIWAEKTGNRFSEFGIGTADIGGYRLWVVPAQNVIQIRHGDDVLAKADFTWTNGEWCILHISVKRSEQNGSSITASITPKTGKSATVAAEDKEPPGAGRGSVWGAPFADKPIRFDDLKLESLE